MNPFDAIGTARISSAIYDRVCRLAVGYQDATDEVAITTRHQPDVDPDWAARTVELVRLTRDHPDVRIGSSVRGAIDMCAVASSLGQVRDLPTSDPGVSLDAALVALSGRIRVREGCHRDPEAIAEGMHQILSDEPTRQRLIARGRIRAASFSWKTSVERVLRIYREVSASS